MTTRVWILARVEKFENPNSNFFGEMTKFVCIKDIGM